MRPHVVEALEEAIEARLLLGEIRGRGFSRLGLEREMHALMAS